MEKDLSKAKVLVCDDSMMVRNKMKKLLTAYGFTQIFEASDGAQAVEKFADIVPDVLVEKVEAGSCKAVSDVIIDPNKVFPQTKKYVVLAGLLGAVVVCGVLVLAHLLHDTIVDDEDVQKKLDLPVLGFIPEV